MRACLFAVVTVGLLAWVCNGTAQETVRGRINRAGTDEAEKLLRSMIVKVNDLIKQYAKPGNMWVGPVSVENFSIRTLDTADVSIVMESNRLGVKLRNAKIHLNANLAVYLNILFGQIRVAGVIDVYGDKISTQLDTLVGISGGKLSSKEMGCNLHVGAPWIDLHLFIINHLANLILGGVMPSVTNGVCNGIKKYGNGMIDSVFQSIPNQVNVFDLFQLHFPVTNFRSWSRHMVAGIGMELRPVDDQPVNTTGMRLLAIPEAEDSHMACLSISDWVVNTASRTFLPSGTSFDIDVGSILKMFFGDIFGEGIFVQGTIADAPLFLVENDEMKISISATGRLLDGEGNPIPNTEIDPVHVSVATPTNTDPLFQSVQIHVTGPITFHSDIDMSNIIDALTDIIDKSGGGGEAEEGEEGEEATEEGGVEDWCKFKNSYLPGYSSGVYAYGKLSEAQEQCAVRSDCGGITQEPYNNNRFTLRKGPLQNGASPHGEVSWVLCAQERLTKRANTDTLKSAINKMFFSKLFSGLSIKFQARHGTLIVCLSAVPNSKTSAYVLKALRKSFRG